MACVVKLLLQVLTSPRGLATLVFELCKFSIAMCFPEKRLIFSDLNLVNYSR